MRLTWRDAVATVLVATIAVVALAVSGSWGWPLLGSVRAGIGAMVVLAVPTCLIGGYAFWDSIAFEHPILAMRDPFLVTAMALGFVAVGIVIGGLISATEAWVIALAAVIGVLWMIATARHAIETEPRLGERRLAPSH